MAYAAFAFSLFQIPSFVFRHPWTPHDDTDHQRVEEFRASAQKAKQAAAEEDGDESQHESGLSLAHSLPLSSPGPFRVSDIEAPGFKTFPDRYCLY